MEQVLAFRKKHTQAIIILQHIVLINQEYVDIILIYNNFFTDWLVGW